MERLRAIILRMLGKIGHILRLDMVYIAKGGFWTTLSFTVSTLTSIVTMIAFGNLLSKEAFGTYNYLLALGASLSFLTISGTSTAVMRSVSRGYENIIPYALKLYLKYNLFAVGIVLFTAIYYGYKGNYIFAGALAMLAIAYPIAEAFHLYANILTGRRKFNTLTKITSIINIFGAIITVTTLLLTNNVLVLIAVYSVMSLVPNIIIYIITVKKIPKVEPQPEQIEELRRTAFHVTGSSIIGIVASYIDKIALFQVAGPASLAIYGFALAGPDRLKSLVKNWTSIALPKLARNSLSQIRLVVYGRIGFSVFLGAFMALVYILLSPILFKLLLPQYLDSIIYSQVLSLALLVVPTTIYMGSIFASQNMLKATYLLNLGSQSMRIVLFIIGSWLWGIWGLVVAYLASHLINAIYSVIVWEIETRRLIKKNEQLF